MLSLAFIVGMFLFSFLREDYLTIRQIYYSGVYFSLVSAFWLLLFFISHLYDLPYLANHKNFFKLLLKLFLGGCLGLCFILLVMLPQEISYSFLILLIVVSLGFLIIWRIFYNIILSHWSLKIILISQAPEAEFLEEYLQNHPQYGYRVVKNLSGANIDKCFKELQDNQPKGLLVLVADKNFLTLIKDKDGLVANLWSFESFDNFYEAITGRVALSYITKEWFQEYVFSRNKRFYEAVKRTNDLFLGLLLLIISMPIWLLASILILIDSGKPILFQSTRVGKGGKEFKIYKFRTMVLNASLVGPSWTLENDERITKFGAFLRKTHLDEVPQVLNIINGTMSFVGPRPEEKSLVAIFKAAIPFYEKRLLIKPGVIGWAQINFPHTASIEEAREKLTYDFYYLKQRNLLLDWVVAIKAWRIPFDVPTH